MQKGRLAASFFCVSGYHVKHGLQKRRRRFRQLPRALARKHEIGFDLPRDDERITARVGDVMLYSGDQIVIFYGSNTWSYTRIGRIEGYGADELRAALGAGDKAAELSLG